MSGSALSAQGGALPADGAQFGDGVEITESGTVRCAAGLVVLLGRRSLLTDSLGQLLCDAGIAVILVDTPGEHGGLVADAVLVCDDVGAALLDELRPRIDARIDQLVIAALDAVEVADADARVPSTATVDDLLRALAGRDARRGGAQRPPSDRRNGAGAPASSPTALTARECDVMALIVDGLSNGRIAQELGISVNTVRTHAQNIMSKLGARSRHEAAGIFATRTGDASVAAHAR